jgi:hypothetical protein
MSNNANYLPSVAPTRESGLGWEDYLADRPYPADYDTWEQIKQRHYERGRLRAAGAKLVYRRVPKKEPRDIVAKTNGLKLVPPDTQKRVARQRTRGN